MNDFRTRLGHAWTEHHGRPPTWVEEMLLDAYAENMEAAMEREFGGGQRILGFRPDLVPSSSIARTQPETEEQRVTRVLVPLVRAAADLAALPGRVEVLGGHLGATRTTEQAQHRHAWDTWVAGRKQSDRDEFGRRLRSELTNPTTGCLTTNDIRMAAEEARSALRRHENGMDCWCTPVKFGPIPIHVDPAIPPDVIRMEPS